MQIWQRLIKSCIKQNFPFLLCAGLPPRAGKCINLFPVGGSISPIGTGVALPTFPYLKLKLMHCSSFLVQWYLPYASVENRWKVFYKDQEKCQRQVQR